MDKILSVFDEALVHLLDDTQAHLLRYLMYLKVLFTIIDFSCSDSLQMQRQVCQNTSYSCHTSLLQQLVGGHVPCVPQRGLMF